MKKVLVYLVVIAMLIASIATLVPASAAYTGLDPEPALDLLAASGLGNPDYLKDNQINLSSGTWVGHEDWNHNVGWDGFSDNMQEGDAKRVVTREIYETTKSDGTTGNVIRVVNNTDAAVGSETAIENIDVACGGFVDGTSYTAKVVAKVVNSSFNGHEMIVSWNSKACTHNAVTESKTVIPADGQWHTVCVTYTYSTEGNGEYLYIGVCENWITSGAEFLIESVEVYETDAFNKEFGYLEASGLGDFNRARVFPNTAEDNYAWAGWVQYTENGATASFRKVIETELSDGSTGKALQVAVEGTQGYGAVSNYAKITNLKPSTHYKLSVIAKFTSDYAYSNGTATGLWNNGMGIGMSINGAYVVAKRFAEANNGQWTKTVLEFVTPADLTAETAQIIVVGGINGETYCSPYELLVESLSLVEEDNLVLNADCVNGIDTAWTAGWGQDGHEKGFDATVSHTDDGTGSMYIYNPTSLATHISQNLTLKANTTYLIGGWLKTEEASTAPTIRLGGDGSPIAIGNISGTKDWTKFETVYTVGAEDMSTSMQIRLWGGSGKVWFDDMYIYEISNPITYTNTFAAGEAEGIYVNGWMGGVSAGIDYTVSHGNDGTGSVKLVTGRYNGDGALEAANQHYSRKIYLVEGVQYSVSGWVKADDTFLCTKAGATGAYISVSNAAGSWESYAGYVDSNDISLDWKYFSTVYTPASTGLYTLSCVAWGQAKADSTVYFDDICVTPYVEGAEDSPFYVEPATPSMQPKAASGNLLANWDFANNLSTGWTGGWANGIAQEYDSLVSHSDDATGSIRLVNKAGGVQHRAQDVTLEANHIYKLSGWIKVSSDYATNGSGGTGAWIGFTDSIGSICGQYGNTTETGWQYFEGTYTSATTVNTSVTLRLWGAGGSAWFDEIALVDITPVENNIVEENNARFADGTTVSNGWGDSATAETGLSDESRTFDGTKSAFISMTEKKHQILNVATVNLKGGHTYKFSGYIKTDAEFATAGNGGEGATLTWGDNMATTGWVTGPADWTYVEGFFTPNADGAYSLQFRVWGAMSQAWVDEIAIVDYTPIDVEGNLLTNGTVDKDLTTGWTAGWGQDGSERTFDSTVSRSKDISGSIKISHPSTLAGHVTQNIELKAGRTYKFGAWVKTGADYSGTGNLQLCLGGDSSPFFVSPSFAAGENDWALIEKEFTIEETKTYGFQVRLWGGEGTVWFDELYVIDVTPPVQIGDVKADVEVIGEETVISDLEVTDSEEGAIEIDLSSVTTDTIKFDAASMEALADITKVTLDFGDKGTVVFDSVAFAAIKEAVGEGELTFTFTVTESEDPEESGVYLTFELTLSSGETAITSFGKEAKVTVTVPFVVPEEKDAEKFCAWYKNGNTLEKMDTTLADGELSFETNHFSEYVVLYDYNAPTADYAVIAVVAFVVALAAAVALRRKERI